MAFSQRVQLINSKANVCTFVASNDGERERGNAPPNAKTKTKKKTKKKNKRSQRACVCVRVCVYRRGERERERERETRTHFKVAETPEIKHERPKKVTMPQKIY